MWPFVEVVGTTVAAALVAALLSVAAALLVASRVGRGRPAPLKRASVWVLDFLYLPLKMAAAAVGWKASLDALMVGLRNAINRAAFARSRKRMLLAPQCLRHLDCPAPGSRRGIQCRECGRCKVGAISAEARRLGYSLFLLTGSAFIPTLIEEEQPDAALLVACPYECNKVMMALAGLTTYAVSLEREGCVNTDVDLGHVVEAMRLGLDDGEDRDTEPMRASP
ncbi:DUF116 domain-containing protein [bacterium]|nr:DUF116 domain-containing protein [bacterium]